MPAHPHTYKTHNYISEIPLGPSLKLQTYKPETKPVRYHKTKDPTGVNLYHFFKREIQSETPSYGMDRDPGDWQNWDNNVGLLSVLIRFLVTRYRRRPCCLNRNSMACDRPHEPKELDLKM